MILLDGYNLIHARPDLQQLVRDGDLETARERLLQVVSRARFPIDKGPVKVIFDGIRGGRGQGTAGMKVLFSRSPQKADELIEQLLSRDRSEQHLVVSSDQQVQQYARMHGADYWSAREFWQKTAQTLTESGTGEKPEPGSDVDEMLEQFRSRQKSAPWDE